MFAGAAVLREAPGAFRIEGVELEVPRDDEVLVRLHASGICHTDLVAAASATPDQVPIVLGHEGAGVIEAVGAAVGDLRVGDRVVLSFAWCGSCRNCRAERMAYCAKSLLVNYSGRRLDGSTAMSQAGEPIGGHFFGQSSFATHVIAAARTVVKVDGDVPFEVLAPLGCATQTGAGAVLNAARPEPGSSIAIFGAGPVGLAATMAARIAGCDLVIVIDPEVSRRDLASVVGATHVLDVERAPAVVRELTKGGVDYAVECVGLPDAIRGALTSLSSPGVCLSVGFRGKANRVEIDQSHLLLGRTLRGSIGGDSVPRRFIPRLVELYQAGQLPVDKLVTTFGFEQIEEAIRATRGGQAVKAVLTFPSNAPERGTR